MASTYSLMLGGKPAESTLMRLLSATEVEESMDMPSAIQLTLPVSRTSAGDLSYVSDPRFGPLATLSVVATAGDSGADGVAPCSTPSGPGGGVLPSGDQCIFDGYILS